MSEQHPDDIVRLAKATTSAEAFIWRNALEDEGIECKVVGDMLDAGIGDIPGMQAEIWVHRNDVARAQEILSRQSTTSSDEDEEEEQRWCLRGYPFKCPFEETRQFADIDDPDARSFLDEFCRDCPERLEYERHHRSFTV